MRAKIRSRGLLAWIWGIAEVETLAVDACRNGMETWVARD